MKQSSVEWLMQQIALKSGAFQAIAFYEDNFNEFQQAKAMHKEEHRKTFNQVLMSNFQNFDDYYNETFNTKEK